MKGLVLVLGLALIVIVVVGLLWLVSERLRWRRRAREYETLLKGLDEPELWLPKAEREAHARKLLKREDDEYMQKALERMMSGNQPDLEEIRKGKSQ